MFQSFFIDRAILKDTFKLKIIIYYNNFTELSVFIVYLQLLLNKTKRHIVY